MIENMDNIIKNISLKWMLVGLSMTTVATALHAQATDKESFAIKAGAGIGLGNTMAANKNMAALSQKTGSGDYGIDFGWTFWKKGSNRLEGNIGLNYTPVSTTFTLEGLNYQYSATADADMDGNAYTRFYELGEMRQKVLTGYFTIPIYVRYAYMVAKEIGLYADLGFRPGFKTSSKISSMSGTSYSYGVYPEYDDLMIDADYINDFGETNLSDASCMKPEANGFSMSMLIGIGAEFRIYGPLAADIGLRYDAGLTNLYKPEWNGDDNFVQANAPVNYLVDKGQEVRSFTGFLKSSHLSQFSVRIALVYRF